MNRILLIIGIVVGGGIVFGIQSLMRDKMQKEKRELIAEKKTTREQLLKREFVSSDEPAKGVGEKSVAACLDDVLELLEVGEGGGLASEERVRYREILRQIEKFSPEDIASFVRLLRNTAPYFDRPGFEESIFNEFVMEAAPWSSLLYLRENREGEHWADLFRSAFSDSLQAEPERTLRLYEKARES